MAEQTNNRDMSDEPDRQDLEDRVDQLEQTISKMLPSRRDALKLGSAALVGGAAMSGSASAGTQQAGTIGTATNPVDLESEDINNADTVTTQDLVVNGSLDGLNSPFDNKVFSGIGQQDDISITGLNLSGDDALVVSLRGDSVGSVTSSLNMTVNSDTSSSYETIHTDGTSTTSSSGFEILKTTQSSGHFAGNITLRQAGGGRLAANGPIAAGQHERIDRTFLSGGVNSPLWPITSVEFNSSITYALSQVTAFKYSLK